MVETSPGLRSGATPLAVRMRPTSLDEVAGQRHLLTPGSPLVALAGDRTGESGSVSVILWGPPGTGKTTLAQAIARSSGRKFVELSAVSAGVRDVRQVMEEARASRDLYGVSTVLFLDEIHRFTKAQQDALLPGVENGWVILVAATTENPSFSVISPLLSRSLLLTLELLTDDDLGLLVDRAVVDPRGLGGKVELEPDARAAIIRLASGDARRALTALEAASVAATQSAAEADAGAPADADSRRRRRVQTPMPMPMVMATTTSGHRRSPSSRPTSWREPSIARCCDTTATATSTTTSSAPSSSRCGGATSTPHCTTSRA